MLLCNRPIQAGLYVSKVCGIFPAGVIVVQKSELHLLCLATVRAHRATTMLALLVVKSIILCVVLFLILKYRRIHEVGLKPPRLPDVINDVKSMAWVNSLPKNVAALCHVYGALVPRAIRRHGCREKHFRRGKFPL